MSQNNTWEIQIDVDWTDIQVLNSGASNTPGPYIGFGYGQSNGSYLHKCLITNSYADEHYGDESGVFYWHQPGNHLAAFDDLAPPTKIKFRWYGPSEGALWGRSTLWVWSYERSQWEWDGNTAGITITDIDKGDWNVILEFSTDTHANVTGGYIEDGTLDNFIVNVGDVICADPIKESTVNDSLKDGGIYGGGNAFYTAYPANSGMLLLGNTNGQGWVFVLFDDVQVPKDAVVTRAVVRFEVSQSQWYETASNFQNAYFELADNPIAPISTVDLQARTRGSAINWEMGIWPDPTGEIVYKETPDLSTIIQPIFNRSGWVPGNSIHSIIISVYDNYNYRVAVAANLKFTTKLIVEYERG